MKKFYILISLSVPVVLSLVLVLILYKKQASQTRTSTSKGRDSGFALPQLQAPAQGTEDIQPAAVGAIPKFDDYPAANYQGEIHPPDWIRQDSEGNWRDQLDKIVDPPEPNFAGSYYIAVHSCGTGCRVHTITDLATGETSSALNMFDTLEERPKTRDGFPYLTVIVFVPTSKMLVAQYFLDDPTGGPLLVNETQVCRERTFVFKDDKFVPITATRKDCQHYGEETD